MALYKLPDGKTIDIPANMSDEEKKRLRFVLSSMYPDTFSPDYERTFGGHALELAKGIPRGFLSGLASAGEGIVNLWDRGNDSPLSEGLRSLQRSIEESSLGPEEAYRDAYSTMLGQGLGSFATFLTPGAIAKGIGLAGKTTAQIPSLSKLKNIPFLGRGLTRTIPTGRPRSIESFGALALALPMAVSEQGQRQEQARMRGEEISGVKEVMSELAALGIGFTEILPVERVFRRFNRANMGRFNIAEAIKSASFQAGVEGFQEGAAGMMQNMTAKGLYDPELPINQSFMDDLSVGAGVGAIADFFMSAIGGRRFAKNRMEEIELRNQINERQKTPVVSKEGDLSPTASTALVPMDYYDSMDDLVKNQILGGKAVADEAEKDAAKNKWVYEFATYNPYFDFVKTPEGYNVLNTRTGEVVNTFNVINETSEDTALTPIEKELRAQQKAIRAKADWNNMSNKVRADQALGELLRINGLAGSGSAEIMGRNILNPESARIPKQSVANYDSKITDIQVANFRLFSGEIKARRGLPPRRTVSPVSIRARAAYQIWRERLAEKGIQDVEKDFYTAKEIIDKKLLSKKDLNDLMNDMADTSDRQLRKFFAAASDVRLDKEGVPIQPTDKKLSPSIPEKVLLKDFKRLAKQKNILLDVKSNAFQNFLETYTGTRLFSKLSPAQKRLAYAKFKRIPSFAVGRIEGDITETTSAPSAQYASTEVLNPPIPFPDFGPRLYTFDQYNAVYQSSLERPDQIVSPKSIMDLAGLDRKAATQMFEDFVESGRLIPQEKTYHEREYITPRGRVFNRRGIIQSFDYDQLRFLTKKYKKPTYKAKWIPRNVDDLATEYTYDLTAKAETPEDFGERLLAMGYQQELVDQLVSNERARQARDKAIEDSGGKQQTIREQQLAEKEQSIKERTEGFDKAIRKVAKRLNVPNRVVIKLVDDIGKRRELGEWTPTELDYRDPAGRILLSVSEARIDAEGNLLSDEQAIINLARTLHHEGIHAFRDLDLFTDKEWTTLSNYVKRVKVPELVSKAAFDKKLSFREYVEKSKAYAHLDSNSKTEEAVAMLFEYYSQDQSFVTGKPRSLFDRIINFIQSIFYSADISGFRSPIDILEDIKSGAIGARPIGEVRSLRELDRAAALAPTVGLAAPIPEPSEEVDPQQVLQEAVSRAAYGPAPAVTAIVHNNKIIAIGRRREMLKQMKQIRRETGDDRKRLHLASAPGRKVGDLWETKPVSRASIRIQDLNEDFIESENLVRSPEGDYRDNPIDATAEAGVIRDEKIQASQRNRRVAERTQDGGPSDIIRTRTGRTLDETYAIEAEANSLIRSSENNIALRLATEHNKTRGQSPYQRKSEQAKPELQTQIANTFFELASSLEERINSFRVPAYQAEVSSENPPTRYEVDRALNNPTQREIEIYESFKDTYPNMLKEHQIESYRDLVIKSYDQLARETQEQYDALLDSGIVLEYHDGAGKYASSKEMHSDVHLFNHLWVFRGGTPHPFLSAIDEKGLSMNDKFRAVHDYFGHAVNGNGFGKIGEETAFASHSQMYSPLASMAMASETRGQNSYVNYSGVNDDLIEQSTEAARAREAYRETKDPRFSQYADALSEEVDRNWQYGEQMPVVLDSELISDAIPDNDLAVPRASVRIKDTQTMTAEEQQELYAGAENAVKKGARGTIPLWNMNADPYAIAVGYKFIQDKRDETIPEDKNAQDVIEEYLTDPEVKRYSRRPELANWDPQFELLKTVSYGKPNPDEARLDAQKLTPFQSLLKGITAKETFTQKFERFRTNFINKYTSWARISKQAQAKLGLTYLADAEAEAGVHYSERARGIMAKLLTTGVIVFNKTSLGGLTEVVDGDFVDMDGNKIEGGLIQVLARLHAYAHKIDQPVDEYLKSYAIVKRSEESEAKTGEKVGYLKTDAKGKVVPTPVTQQMIDDANKMAEMHPIIKETYENYQKWNNALITYAESTGILNSKEADLWRNRADYYPYYRRFEEDEEYDGPTPSGKILGKSPFDKELVGSYMPINEDMLTAITRNSLALITRGMRNEAVRRIMRDAEVVGAAERLKEKPKGMGPDVIWYQTGGKGTEVYFRVSDPMLVKSMESFGGTLYQTIEKYLAIPSGALRDLITRSPDFILVNMMRDTLSAFVTSGASMVPVVDTAKNFFTPRGNDVMEQLERLAVIGGYDFSNDPKNIAKYIQRQIDKQTGVDGGLSLKNGVRLAWDWLGGQTTKSDAATRIAVYEDVFKKVYNDELAKGTEATEAQIIARAEAGFQALEVINFSRRGLNPMFKVYTAAVPFLNARIQGLDVFYRSFSGQYSSQRYALSKGEITRNALIRAGGLSLLTALYYVLASDSDEYKNARREVRDDNWIIPIMDDFALKIPIPFEVGVVFKVFPERLADILMGEGSIKELVTSMNRQLTTSLAMPGLPAPGMYEPSLGIQAIAPLVDVMLNHDSYTRTDIVPYYMETGIEPGLQKHHSTNELANRIGRLFNWSPIKIQYVMQGYSGSLGTYALTAMDAVTRAVTGTPMMPQSVERYPFIRRFAQTKRGGGLQQQFYELRGEVNQVVQTLNDLKKKGDVDTYIAYRDTHQDTMNVRGAVLAIDRYMKNWRNKRDRIILSEDISQEVKKQLLKQLENERDRRLASVPIIKDRANIPFADFNL